jgi:RNA polymerase sigma-70 factor (ECF subfamily)
VGRQRWPALRPLALDELTTHLETAGVEPEALQQHASDLYLAAAAISGDKAALAAFEDELLSNVARWLAALRVSEDVVDEVKQTLRVKMLVGSPPRLVGYRGVGALGAWVRVSAVRTALDLVAARPAEPSEAARAEPAPVFKDLENEILRQRYGGLFERALHEALSSLSTRQRSLLRFHYSLGMSVEQIGRIYQVHKATAARWLSDTRDELESALTTRAWEMAGLQTGEFQSIWRVVGSGIELSLSRVLATDKVASDPARG